MHRHRFINKPLSTKSRREAARTGENKSKASAHSALRRAQVIKRSLQKSRPSHQFFHENTIEKIWFFMFWSRLSPRFQLCDKNIAIILLFFYGFVFFWGKSGASAKFGRCVKSRNLLVTTHFEPVRARLTSRLSQIFPDIRVPLRFARRVTCRFPLSIGRFSKKRFIWITCICGTATRVALERAI